MEILEFFLVRKYFTNEYTIGKLSVDGSYLTDTLEPVVRDLHDINHDGDFTDTGEGKIMGKTAIPYGRYEIKLVYWAKHKRKCPLLQNVPGFTGIFIHAGNTAEDSEGCILVGENKEKGKVLYSRYHTEIVTNYIRKAVNEGAQIFITIK